MPMTVDMTVGVMIDDDRKCWKMLLTVEEADDGERCWMRLCLWWKLLVMVEDGGDGRRCW
jgi:hypothetical protein